MNTMRVTAILARDRDRFASFAIYARGTPRPLLGRGLVGECRLFADSRGKIFDYVFSTFLADMGIAPKGGDDFDATVRAVSIALTFHGFPFKRND